MKTPIQSSIRCRSLRAWLAALGVAVALASFGPSAAIAQRARRAAAAQTVRAPSAASDDASGVVNIQTASREQLQLLPGIGPAKAEAIVQQREQRAFRRVEDLMRVRGIGRATFRRLRPLITVAGDTTLAAQAHAVRASDAENEPVDEREE